jgi:hypothetical protein
LPAAGLAHWDRLLLSTDGALFQFPYWNEPLRQLGFAPRYLVLSAAARPRAFVTVLQVGPPGARIGLIQRGPVPLDGAAPTTEELAGLSAWARRRGFTCLRCSHERPDILDTWAMLPAAERADPFPFFREPQEELRITLSGDEPGMLAGFQPIARRNLRRAAEVGYEIASHDDPEFLRTVWPLFQALARRKHFTYRPLNSFVELLERARPHDAARVFTASLEERVLQAILVVRDGQSARYIIGALDIEGLGERESPSVLLHWHAMRHFQARGARVYDLGTSSGPVHRFKQKFRPTERHLALPVTIVLHPWAYRAWMGMALTPMRSVWPRLKRLLTR